MTNQVYNGDPFYIAILGDFSGRTNNQSHDVTTLTKRSFREVNLDNIDVLIGEFEINLQLWLDDNCDEPIDIPIQSIEDFHPDQIFNNVEIFSRLQSLRDCLNNNKMFESAISELRRHIKVTDLTDSLSKAEIVPKDERLTQIKLNNSSAVQKDSSSPCLPIIDDILCQLVTQSMDLREEIKQEECVVSIEQAIASHMQFILHHPDFQALEAGWRSVEFLLKRLETGERLRFFIKDISQHELELDLSNDNITEASLYDSFCNKAPGNVTWGLILGNYQFRDRIEDIMTLLHVGAIARRAQAPFISAVNERLIGCESFAITPEFEDWDYKLAKEVKSAWSMLRDSDEAGFLSLVVPGFLLRMPYSNFSNPVETFEFDEMPEVHCHSCYLWGNGAFIKTEQLARAYLSQGWDMDPAFVREVDRLPLHKLQREKEEVVKPCAEIHLDNSGIQKIIQLGLIPLKSVKNSDVIRSDDFHFLST